MIKGELYELLGFGWRMPIMVEWLQKELACVRLPEVPLLKKQIKVIVDTLNYHKQLYQNDSWYLSGQVLRSLAQESAREDAEDVIVWKCNEMVISDDDDFESAYCNWRDAIPAIRDNETFRIIWGSIRRFMLRWLVYNDKPLKLGFATMNAFCVRANWKNIVIGRHTARGHNLPDIHALRDPAIKKTLHRDFLTAWDGGRGVCQWSLDITPNRVFHAATAIRETKRKNGAVKYELQVLRYLKSDKHKGRMYEAFLSYIQEARRPLARLPHGFGESNISEWQGPEIVPQPIEKWIQTPVVIDKSMRDKSAYALVQKDASVPSLQDIQSDDEDLWDAGKLLDAAGENKTGEPGLLVLPSSEEQPGSKLLAGGADGVHSGVEMGVEQQPDQH